MSEPSPASASPAEIVRLYWDVCWNQRDTDRLGEVFHAEYLHGRTPFTPERHAQIIHDTVAAFPDLQVRVDELEERDEMVITRSRFIGTHGGSIFGLSATGRTIDAPSLDVYYFRDGLVTRLWHLFDHLPIVAAIGAEVRIGDEVASFD